MKKYNIVFLFILLLFLGLSKNINISTKDNISVTSNVTSTVRSDEEIPYVDDSLITIDESTNTITKIDNTNLKGTIYIPPFVTKNGKKIEVKSVGTGKINENIFTVPASSTTDSVILPYTLTSIGRWAFNSVLFITTIVIPENCVVIGESSFANMSKLTTMYILGNVKAIRQWTFNFSTKLTKIYYFGDGITEPINGDGVFDSSMRVTMYFESSSAHDITLASNTTFKTQLTLSTDYSTKYSSEYNVIYNTLSQSILLTTLCKENDEVVIPSEIGGTKITTIGNSSYSKNRYIVNLIISEGITKIEDFAFQYCYSISNVRLPNSLVSIGQWAFVDLHDVNINDGVIPNNVTTISTGAFSGCYVEEYTLGSGVVSISDTAFGYNQYLKKIYINSVVTTVGSTAFTDHTNSTFILEFKNKDIYNKNTQIKSLFSNYSVYKVEVQYQNVGLFNNPSFTTEFQADINKKNPVEDEKGILIYTYYAGDNLLIPTLSNFNSIEGQQLKLYIDNKYSIEINSSNTTSDNQITSGKLTKGTVNDTLVIYCNLYTDPTSTDNQAKYEVASFDSNNNPVSNIFTINDLNNVINLRFTNDVNTGVTGLPVVGYTYTYTWYVKESNSSTYTLISNNNDKEPSTLTLIPLSGKDLNCVYRCTIQIKNTSGTSTIFSKEVTLTYEKEDITVVVNDQTASSTGAISSVYGTNYTASINGVVLSEDEMNLYFGSNYGLVSKSNNGNIEISFFGTLQEPYRSNYNVNTLQTGILTTKTNSTNLILISVTSGLFVVEVIVFMVVIFKQRSRG